MTDGLLLTRRERLRVFAERFAAGVGPTLVLVIAAAALGVDATAVAIAVMGVLLGLVVATSARSTRGALIGGVAIAVALLVLQIVLAWFITHPIQSEEPFRIRV